MSVLASADYVDELHQLWQRDPSSVSEEWRLFFTGFDLAMCQRPCVAADRANDQSRVASLIFAYRNVGHLIAKVNPLEDAPSTHPSLELEAFSLTEEHLDQVFDTGHLGGPQRMPLREIIDFLRDTYCRSIGVEYLHIQNVHMRRWLQQEMEPIRNCPAFPPERRIAILKQLIDAELFETFTHSRYVGQKRFSLEGAESLIPALHQFLETAADTGAEEVVLGMAHRGRLNVLANILHRPYSMIFHEFEDNLAPDPVGGDGDVKYHRGYSSDYEPSNGRTIHVSLTANPSHLEAVDPVVEGRVRAKQRYRGDTVHRRKVLPLLIHGDAAFAGQGLVAETFNLSQLKGYSTGGTVHIVVNNQIGFTTLPGEARSSRYPTDVAKYVEAPIFHVNGDDPEAVCFVVDLALRFRQTFNSDVVIDMLCYRKHGHNESDEPAFTQPLMYQKIENHPPVRAIYQLRLEHDRVLSIDDSVRLSDEFADRLYDAFKTVKIACPLPDALPDQPFSGVWTGLNQPYVFDPAKTGVPEEVLEEVARALTTVPEGFHLNRKVGRRLPEQLETVKSGGSVDWAFAELLAFGSLLAEGLPVRLSGQDSIRGTFSQRHAAWFDTKNQEIYIPLNNIREGQARFCVYNSMLSEAAVLGFDYGYSLVEPNMLVLWEAQFGDFANGAQVIIDQFITAALDKWQRGSGIVMLLPHGYEGQGPEHSNAYLERYLTLGAEDNIQVCNLSTPAQYFHVLRRQLKRGFRRPLVIMAPKSMLRHKRAVSPLSDLVSGRFSEMLDDVTPPQGATRRLVLCSGKVYYDLLEGREEHGVNDVAILRVEQFYPFNDALLRKLVTPYKGAEQVVWVQEETKNRGGWSFMLPQLLELFPYRKLRYVGREPSASPATGSARVHREQQARLVAEALID
ncbi:MAG: 2-oxoglutarate dehydrogenase E1 component [Holophagae bacterium]|nr:MAG: 2-oxoglutarate dehydrogenase E1 component [Holophagae bacterium]